MKTLAPLLATLFLSVIASPDYGNEHHFRVPPASVPAVPTPPDRGLVWGDINIIHTSDIHGWLLGHNKSHPPEVNYKGTFGDFASFVSRMNATAQSKGRDLLLVDTGDLRDGTGLSDGDPDKRKWPGESTDEFFLRLPYDVMTIGNHELYKPAAIAYDIHANFSKQTKRYLTSNAFIHDNVLNKSVPIGLQFAKFKTANGKYDVTAFGVTFNATGIAPNVSVQPAEIMVNQPWFQAAIKEPPSFFLLTGHMSVGKRYNDWRAVVKPIRDLHKDIPIIILGGHTHTRNCSQFGDDKVVALESGSYMDTVGWLSFNLSTSGTNKNGPLDYSRRYLDPNRVTYKYHTGAKTDIEFDTIEGKKITEDLLKLHNAFNLSHVWGHSPEDYSYYHVSNNTALDLFVGMALPSVLNNAPCKGSTGNQKLFFIGSGVLRYDIYKGEFNQNDQLTAAPYADKLWCIPNVALADAKNAEKNMNLAQGSNGHAYSLVDFHDARRREMAEVDAIHRDWLLQMSADAYPGSQQEDLTLGYVTQDQCGTKQKGDGDDVKHNAIVVLDHWPKIVTGPSGVNATLVDLVIIDHGSDNVLGNLSISGHTYRDSDIDKHFTDITTNEVLGLYAQREWNNNTRL